MALLRKVKGTTLIETLVATVILVVLFVISGLILSNVFSSTINNNTDLVKTRLKEVQYLEMNGMIDLPYQEEFGDWAISLEKAMRSEQQIIEIEALNKTSNKTISKIYYEIK